MKPSDLGFERARSHMSREMSPVAPVLARHAPQLRPQERVARLCGGVHGSPATSPRCISMGEMALLNPVLCSLQVRMGN